MALVINGIVLVGAFAAVAVACLLGVLALARNRGAVAGGAAAQRTAPGGQEPSQQPAGRE